MERKKLQINENPFDSFKSSSSDPTEKKVADKEVIEAVANQYGFTKREPNSKPDKKNIYVEQFNVRCRNGMNELVADIMYMKKLKKQELLELALKAYLVENKLETLNEKLTIILNPKK